MGSIRIAENAGFCFGVKNAVDSVYDAISKAKVTGNKVYTLGEIIHNDSVIEKFKSENVEVLDDLTDLDIKKAKNATVIIRAHGVGKAVYKRLNELNCKYIDATCPFVRRIQRLVEEESKNRFVIIAGDAKHPEIKGIIGHCQNRYKVISNTDEAEKFEINRDTSLLTIVQTTFLLKNFQDIVAILDKKGYYNNDVHNTICDATTKRQLHTKELSENCDKMLVIGDTKSSNTRKLYELAKIHCNDTWLIQDSSGLDSIILQSTDSIGITAGASTPNNIIEEVHTKCLNKVLNKC